jgi:hypothetical protein
MTFEEVEQNKLYFITQRRQDKLWMYVYVIEKFYHKIECIQIVHRSIWQFQKIFVTDEDFGVYALDQMTENIDSENYKNILKVLFEKRIESEGFE